MISLIYPVSFHVVIIILILQISRYESYVFNKINKVTTSYLKFTSRKALFHNHIKPIHVITDKASMDEIKNRLFRYIDNDDLEKDVIPSNEISSSRMITLTVKELKRKSKEIMKSNNITSIDVDNIPLNEILPFLLNQGDSLEILGPEDSNNEENEVYVTELELQRLWREFSHQPFGKSIDKFDLMESLLLIRDNEYDMIMGTQDDISSDMSSIIIPFEKKDIENPELIPAISVDDVIKSIANENEPELYISSQVCYEYELYVEYLI